MDKKLYDTHEYLGKHIFRRYTPKMMPKLDPDVLARVQAALAEPRTQVKVCRCGAIKANYVFKNGGSNWWDVG